MNWRRWALLLAVLAGGVWAESGNRQHMGELAGGDIGVPAAADEGESIHPCSEDGCSVTGSIATAIVTASPASGMTMCTTGASPSVTYGVTSWRP